MIMKNKYIALLAFLIIGLASCSKTSTPFDPAKQAAADDATIKAYIAANNLDSVKKDTASGLYYKIITPGTGAYPTATSTVNVNYKGTLTNGSVFAPEAATQGLLTGYIPGWQVGVPHINTGGTILLLIPSALGYGDESPGAGIPANAVLIFTVSLISFK